MKKAGRRRRGRRIAIVLVLLLLIAVAGGTAFLTLQQVGILRREAEKILALDVEKEELDTNIYAKGDYGRVEETMKEYMGEYISSLRTIKTIFQDQEFAALLSVDNIQADGPLFTQSLQYLQEKEATAEAAFQQLEELAETDRIEAAIQGKGLKSFFKKLYDTQMLENLQANFMYGKEEIQEAREKVSSSIASRRNAINFLVEYQEDWKLEDGKLKFDSNSLLKQYNALAEAIGQ